MSFSPANALSRRGNCAAASALAVLGWIGLVAVSRILGVRLLRHRPDIHVSAAPLMGVWEWISPWQLWLPILCAAAIVLFPWRLIRRWRPFLAVVGLAHMGWVVSLAVTDGAAALRAPLQTRYEYLAVLPRVEHIGSFLHSYASKLSTYPTHVRGHPPGMVLVLEFFARLGLGGAGWAAMVVIVSATLGTVAVLIAVRELADEASARRLAPFLILSPAAVWVGTSSDAFFVGVVACGIASAIVATGDGPRRDRLAIMGGVLMSFSLYLSYGLVLLLIIPGAIIVARRAWRSAVLAAVGATVVVVAFTASGFWWFDGLAATHALYRGGTASVRPYEYFLVANLGAAALATGPAVAVGLVRLRKNIATLVPLAALTALMLADLSGLSKGEVERIWLPFFPWLSVACITMTRHRSRYSWLVIQASTAIVLQGWLRSPW